MIDYFLNLMRRNYINVDISVILLYSKFQPWFLKACLITCVTVCQSLSILETQEFMVFPKLWLTVGCFLIKPYFFRASHLELRRQQHRSSWGPELRHLPLPRRRLRRPLQAGQQQTGPLRDLQIQQEANRDQPQKELQWSHGESQGTNIDIATMSQLIMNDQSWSGAG